MGETLGPRKEEEEGEDKQHSQAATCAPVEAALAAAQAAARVHWEGLTTTPAFSLCRWDSQPAHTEIQEDSLKPELFHAKVRYILSSRHG